jgi:phenylacetate-CoA ligase
MYLINGELHTDVDLDNALALLHQSLPQHLNTPLDSATVLTATANFARHLLSAELPLDDAQRQALIDFCQPHALQTKLKRELGDQAETLRRLDYRQSQFERWSPLGLVVHVTPANAPLLACCAMIESLLAGNINWLRPSRSDHGLTARVLHALVQCDPSGQLRYHLAVLPLATEQIGRLCKMANGVSAWGGEAALQAIRQQLPPGCRWIDWGHRISFAYLTPDAASPQALEAIVDEVCRLDQQACSSPQWLLVDSDDPIVLEDIGCALAKAFERRAGHWPALVPTVQEASEISSHSMMTRLSRSFSGSHCAGLECAGLARCLDPQ